MISCAPRYALSYRFLYRPPTKLWEGNVFTCVCVCVCVCVCLSIQR